MSATHCPRCGNPYELNIGHKCPPAAKADDPVVAAVLAERRRCEAIARAQRDVLVNFGGTSAPSGLPDMIADAIAAQPHPTAAASSPAEAGVDLDQVAPKARGLRLVSSTPAPQPAQPDKTDDSHDRR